VVGQKIGALRVSEEDHQQLARKIFEPGFAAQMIRQLEAFCEVGAGDVDGSKALLTAIASSQEQRQHRRKAEGTAPSRTKQCGSQQQAATRAQSGGIAQWSHGRQPPLQRR